MTLTARDIMRRDDLYTVSPETTVEELERGLLSHDVSGAPVVDSAGALVGLVSQRDLLRHLMASHGADRSEKDALATPISELMGNRLRTVPPDADLPTVARMLRRHHIHRVLVAEGRNLIGIISVLDLVRPFEDPELVRTIWGAPQWRHWTPMRHATEEPLEKPAEKPLTSADK